MLAEIKHRKSQDSRWWDCLSEKRYLRALIFDLEKRAGLIQFVELSAQVEGSNLASSQGMPPQPPVYEPELVLLIDDVATSTNSRRRLHINSIREVIHLHPKLVLSGEPGSGKTTTIRRLALDAAKKRLHDSRAPLPLLVELARWHNAGSPLDFIREHWPLETELKLALSRNGVCLFLDGLNEMGREGPAKAKLLREWLQGWDAAQQVIITCRTSDYKDELNVGLPQVVIEEMDIGRIRQFAKNYLGARASSFLHLIMPEHEKGIDTDSRSLAGLARNPFMLTALILLYSTSSGLPGNRGKLFEELVKVLWKREENRGTIGKLNLEDVKAALSDFAFSMIDENRSTSVPSEYALLHIRSKGILRTSHNAYLLEIAEVQVRFRHQLMQEYFAALK